MGNSNNNKNPAGNGSRQASSKRRTLKDTKTTNKYYSYGTKGSKDISTPTSTNNYHVDGNSSSKGSKGSKGGYYGDDDGSYNYGSKGGTKDSKNYYGVDNGDVGY